MNRRGFLSALVSAGLSAAIDPEKLLWEPGKKLISIPAPVCPDPLAIRFITRYSLDHLRNDLVFHRVAFVLSYPAIHGDTMNVRRPQHFTPRSEHS